MQGEAHEETPKPTEKSGEKDSTSTAPAIVRPSSLNYKISLLDAVTAFVQKDKTTEQVIDVEIEEPINKNRLNFNVLDDALYVINKVSVV